MYWEEDENQQPAIAADIMVDVVFTIACKLLPQDHAHALAAQISELLPWLTEDTGSGVHTIHVAESGNGWQRPGDMLHPSRRTKLILRVSKERATASAALCGKNLDIAGHQLLIKDLVDTRAMSTLTTLFSRYVVSPSGQDESAFLDEAARALGELHIKPRKLLCGREQSLSTGREKLITRSLMIADLEINESLTLQQRGLGSHRFMGCGLFIPHKSIHKVGADKEPA